MKKKFTDKDIKEIAEQLIIYWKDLYPSQERDPKRIDAILDLIKDIWKANPNLRLCQLIGNCFDSGDNYYKEDDMLYEKLIEIYLEEKET